MHPPSSVSVPLLPPAGDILVERFATRPGPVALEPVAEHRIKVHTGAPVTGTCHDRRFRYAHGDVDLLPAGSADRWQEDGPSDSVMLRFAPALLARAADELGLDGARAALPLRHQLRDPQIQHIAWALDADQRAGRPGGRLYADGLAQALLGYLLMRHRAATPAARGLSRPQLQRVAEFIEAHLDEDLSLARLAQVAGLGVSHFKTQFKRATGMPAHAYVVRRRVERARALLLRRDRTAAQVAAEAGFAHQSHMVRCLRKALGAAAAPLLRRAPAPPRG
ncbi:AraC family transcriptional regulator [Vulcaniibacterium tengchongense]|uniref:AraC family transcriptional regulator n=1 Tax=Vulcaniibacterium tengchongense TaxID=1273429 RepID=A0A3N4VAF7_9GAMM|nr:AraC family transcriptional regulator [Vulcaniibacterium tengchongense]RPE79972.1 AraC family transcriptional regulator [Vulcaniibacterium tengchongense]